MTLACEDANSKLVEVVTVASGNAEKRVDDRLMQIWKQKFGHEGKFWVRFVANGSVKILKLSFRRNFEAEVWSVVFSCCLVEVMKLNLCHNSEGRSSPDFEFDLSQDANVRLGY